MIAKVRTVSLKRPPEHACQRIGLAGRRRPARMSLRTVIVGMGVAWEGGGLGFRPIQGRPTPDVHFPRRDILLAPRWYLLWARMCGDGEQERGSDVGQET
jgi:hypothetical protein